MFVVVLTAIKTFFVLQIPFLHCQYMYDLSDLGRQFYYAIAIVRQFVFKRVVSVYLIIDDITCILK